MIKWRKGTNQVIRAISDNIPIAKCLEITARDSVANRTLAILSVAMAFLSFSIILCQFEILPAYANSDSGSTYLFSPFGAQGPINNQITASTTNSGSDIYQRTISENLGVSTTTANGPSSGNSYVRSLSERVNVGTFTGNPGTPYAVVGNSYSRSLSESVTFGSSTGNQPPRAYSRGISDGISITTSGQQPYTPIRAAIANEGSIGSLNSFGQQPTNSSNRIDERTSRSSMNGRGDYLQRLPSKITVTGDDSAVFRSVDNSSCMSQAGSLGDPSCSTSSEDSDSDASQKSNGITQFIESVYLPKLCASEYNNGSLDKIWVFTYCNNSNVSGTLGIANQQILGLAVLVPTGYVVAAGLASRQIGIAWSRRLIEIVSSLNKNSRKVRIFLILVIIVVSIPSEYWLPPAYAAKVLTVDLSPIRTNNDVPSSTVVATYGSGSTIMASQLQPSGFAITSSSAVTVTFSSTISTNNPNKVYKFSSNSDDGGSGATKWSCSGTQTVTCTPGSNNNAATTLTGSYYAAYTASISDSLSVSSSISRAKAFSRTPSDSFGTADSILKSVTRSISDTISTSEDITKSVTRSISDTLIIVDSLSWNRSLTKSLSGTIEIGDLITLITTRTIEDGLTVSPSISASVHSSRSPDESIIVTDSLNYGISRHLDDSLDVLSSTTTPVGTIRLISENLTISTNTTFRVERMMSDIMNITDSSTQQVTRSVYESIPINEAIHVEVIRSVSIDDEVTVIEYLSKKLTAPISDILSLTDDVAFNIRAAFSDSLTVSDSIRYSTLTLVEDGDTIIVEDSILTFLDIHRTITDSVSVGESDNYAVTRGISESLSTSDSISAQTTRRIGEIISITDSVSDNVIRSISDLIATSDSITSSSRFSRLPSDPISFSDAIEMNIIRTLQDYSTINDYVGANSSKIRNLEDSATVSESISIRMNNGIQDSMESLDTLSVNATYARTITDSILISDSLGDYATMSIGDSVELEENLLIVINSSRTASDTIALTDSVSTDLIKEVEDTATVTDNLSLSINAIRPTSESVVVSDLIISKVSRYIFDAFSIEDSAIANMNFSRSLTDDLSLDDSTITITMSKPLSETLMPSDSIAAIFRPSKSFLDYLALNDTINSSLYAERAASENITLDDVASTSFGASRTVNDSMIVIDIVVTEVGASRSANDNVILADMVVSLSNLTRSMDEDAITTSDSISTNILYDKTIAANELIINDTLSLFINSSRINSDSLSITDTTYITFNYQRELQDSFATSDTTEVQLDSIRPIMDGDSLGVAATLSGSLNGLRQMTDLISISDSVTGLVAVGGTFADALSISDNTSEILNGSRSISSDELVVFESISSFVVRSSADASETIFVSDSATSSLHFIRLLDESVSIEETVSAGSSLSVSEELILSDSVSPLQVIDRLLEDEFSVSDSAAYPPIISSEIMDEIALSDSLSILQQSGNTMTDTISISDSIDVSSPMSIGIEDGLQITESFTDLSIQIRLNLNEALQLTSSEANPIEAQFTLPLGEGLFLGDGFGRNPIDIPISLEEMLSMQESVSSSSVSPSTTSISLGETLATSDAISIQLSLIPPNSPSSNTILGTMPRIIVVSATSGRTNGTDPLAATVVTGNYTSSSGISTIVQQIGLDNYEIHGWNVGTGNDTTMVSIPTFMLNMIPTSDVPSTTAFLTPPISELPAEANVIIPVDIALSKENISEQPLPLRSLTIQFSPESTSQNFTMLINMLDKRPVNSDNVLGSEAALYLNFQFAGEFNGSTPSMSAYYAKKPNLQFTISDEWAVENNLKRDGNGVPILDLYLFDEETDQWSKLSDSITRPSGPEVDSQHGHQIFTYIASLEHFSTYAISGSKANSGSSSNSDSHQGQQTSKYSVLLKDDAVVAEDSVDDTAVVRSVENGLGTKTFTVQIYNQLVVSAKPIPFATDKNGNSEYASLEATVEDVRTDFDSFRRASAEIMFDVSYYNGSEDVAPIPMNLVLHYWYQDESGTKIFESTKLIKVELGKSNKINIAIPFDNPGRYYLFAEIHVAPPSDDGTQMDVESGLTDSISTDISIPWIAVNLYPILIIAFAILIFAVFAWLYALKMRKMPPSSTNGESPYEG